LPNLVIFSNAIWRRERRSFFDSEASNDRDESLDERLPIPGPPARIGELKNLALPVCPCSGIFHVTSDRAEHWSDDSRLKAHNFPSKELFAVTTHRSPQGRIEVIDGFMTQVHQVAAACTKHGKEILIVNLRVSNLKGHTHGPIHPELAE
jgi:hypothetical protein